MSTATLKNLRDYLYGTLTLDNMYWLAAELTNYAKKEEEELMRPYTKEEINAMLDQAEVNFAAGRGIPHEEVMREMEDEIAREERDLEMAEAV